MRNIPLFLVIPALTILLLGGCADTKYLLQYETSAEEKVWPPLPDKPRYRYVGQLFGESNLTAVDDGGAGAAIGRFFKALVGLGDEADSMRNLFRPQTGAVDDKGRVIVTDVGRQAVFVFDQAAGEVNVWRAVNEDVNFVSPVGVAVAGNGDILVTDSELRQVIRLDSQGGAKGTFGLEDFERPTGIAIDPQSQRIFVADTGEHNIKVYSDAGKLVQVIGKVGTGPLEFNAPTHLSFVNKRLYVTDTFNARVQILDSEGKFLRSVGSRGLYVGNLVRPKGVTADSEGNIYIIESFHDYLLVYDQDGRFLLPIGGTGAEVGKFYLPAGVWTDHQDRIYVADMYNRRVVVFQYLRDQYLHDREGQENSAGSKGASEQNK